MYNIKVLLAGDFAIMRDGSSELIRREPDIEVVGEASDGEEAVKLATECQPNVLVMDITMPKCNCIEAIKRIKELQPSISILILTTYNYDQYISTLLELGIAGYLPKCVRVHELIDAIQRVYLGGSVLHPVIASRIVEHPKFSTLTDNKAVVPLSKREIEILRLATTGISNKDLANQLNLSHRTIQVHWGNIFNKLGVASRIEAILYGLRSGWFTLQELP